MFIYYRKKEIFLLCAWTLTYAKLFKLSDLSCLLLWLSSFITFLGNSYKGHRHNLMASKFLHCLKSVQIRSFFWSVFCCIQTEYGVNLCIQPEYLKIRTGKNSAFEHFSHSAITTLNLLKSHGTLFRISGVT